MEECSWQKEQHCKGLEARESRKTNCSWDIESGGVWEGLMKLHM